MAQVIGRMGPAASVKTARGNSAGFNPDCTRIGVVIPALNEDRSLGRVLVAIPSCVHEIVVVDNGSTDKTNEIMRASGAKVICEPRRGYGAACLAGMAALGKLDIVVFLDADSSDDPSEMDRLVAPIARGDVELVIGSRTLGSCEPGALTPQQRFGNVWACRLIRLFWRQSYTDLGPFRAIQFDALQALEMDDQAYDWSIQMQLRAARLGMSVVEVPVSYLRRIGESKIAGTFRGVLRASAGILSRIVREMSWRPKKLASFGERLVVFTSYPVPGETKTRFIDYKSGKAINNAEVFIFGFDGNLSGGDAANPVSIFKLKIKTDAEGKAVIRFPNRVPEFISISSFDLAEGIPNFSTVEILKSGAVTHFRKSKAAPREPLAVKPGEFVIFNHKLSVWEKMAQEIS